MTNGERLVLLVLKMTQAEAAIEKREADEAAGRRRDECAWALFKSWLTPQQLAEFNVERYFSVRGRSGRWYRIYPTTAYNVVPLDKDGMLERGAYCVTPFVPPDQVVSWLYRSLPLGDHLLAQKIWLETDDEATLTDANFTPHSTYHQYHQRETHGG
jgi:hypothetical protein